MSYYAYFLQLCDLISDFFKLNTVYYTCMYICEAHNMNVVNLLFHLLNVNKTDRSSYVIS